MVHSHKALTDLANISQAKLHQTSKQRLTIVTRELVSDSRVFSLTKYLFIPLLFTSKLEFNLPAKFARHPKWRLNVDG